MNNNDVMEKNKYNRQLIWRIKYSMFALMQPIIFNKKCLLLSKFMSSNHVTMLEDKKQEQ